MLERAPLIDAADLAATGDGPLLVALSGGLDSTVLLHALAALPAARMRGLRALHVHHGLHAQADAWAQACGRLCQALDVPLALAHASVPRDGGEGLEAAARRVRHAAFEHALGGREILVLAHHLDDQAETFLLRALRGSGPEGLGSMAAWRRFGRGWMWRPLLERPRAELAAYAQAHALAWIDDPSNADTAFDRNFLRHRVLPLLRERWPRADVALTQAARLNLEAASLLSQEDAIALAGVRTADPRGLSRPALRALPSARRARVLRAWIDELGLPPLPAQGVAAIEHDLLQARNDSRAAFRWRDAQVRAWGELLHADRVREALPRDLRQAWDGRSPLPLPGASVLRLEGADGFDEPLQVHARQGGERIVLPGRTHSHALKHVLQDLAIPPWERERLPLLSTPQGELLAAGDLACSARFDAWLRAHGARLRWSPD